MGSIINSSILFALLAFPITCFAQEQGGYKTHYIRGPIDSSQYRSAYIEDPAGQETHKIEVDGNSRSYQIYAPSKSEKPRAAVLLLHGAKRTGISLVHKWKNLADLHNIILVGPHGYNGGWSSIHDGTIFLDAIVKDAQKRHKIDQNRFYLFGHSLGANYALFLSIAHSDIFAATAVHAGKYLGKKRFEQFKVKPRKTPVALFVGTDDKLFALEDVKKTAQLFTRYGHDVELSVLNDHNHWYYDIAPYINQRAWAFMSGYRLDKANRQ